MLNTHYIYDDDIELNSSVIKHMTRFPDSILYIRTRNDGTYLYHCESDKQAKVWFDRISEAKSAGSEFSKFKKLRLSYTSYNTKNDKVSTYYLDGRNLTVSIQSDWGVKREEIYHYASEKIADKWFNYLFEVKDEELKNRYNELQKSFVKTLGTS